MNEKQCEINSIKVFLHVITYIFDACERL